MVSGQMTRGAAISMALLAIIVLALIVLLAWPTHSSASDRLSLRSDIFVPFARRNGRTWETPSKRHRSSVHLPGVHTRFPIA